MTASAEVAGAGSGGVNPVKVSGYEEWEKEGAQVCVEIFREFNQIQLRLYNMSSTLL